VHAACPRCNTRDLTRLREIDWLDERSRNPLRWMIRPFGAPLYHCGRCRFQFPDVRKLHPHARKAYD
jgi:DNA-directed RNA polymerase subunit RPC12/RpoP